MSHSSISCLTDIEVLFAKSLEENDAKIIEDINPICLNPKQKKLYDFIKSGETSFCKMLNAHGIELAGYAMHLCNAWARKKLEDKN